MHPTFVEIDLQAIRQNILNIRQKVQPAEVMAVVKADAYGHGAVPVARAALEAGATRLAVAHVTEGAVLRQAGITAPIQLLGGFFPQQLEAIQQYQLECTLCNLENLAPLQAFAQKNTTNLPVHVKFDTGMHRVGFAWQQADAVFAELSKSTGLQFIGLMTHLASSDACDKTYANEQLARFHDVISKAKQAGLHIPYIHAANSGAIMDLPEAHFNLVRAGIAMYGYYPSAETSESVPLQPGLTWRSRLLQVKNIQAGDAVSYNGIWRADRETCIGTVTVGYADGYNRQLSNRIHAVVNGRRVPVVGRVCMDMILLDLGPDAQEKAGDIVTLLGSDGTASVPMHQFCQALDTIPYEVTCMISKRVERKYVG